MSSKADLCVAQQGAALRATVTGIQELQREGWTGQGIRPDQAHRLRSSHIHLPLQMLRVRQQREHTSLVGWSALLT